MKRNDRGQRKTLIYGTLIVGVSVMYEKNNKQPTTCGYVRVDQGSIGT